MLFLFKSQTLQFIIRILLLNFTQGDPLPWAMDWLKAKGLLSSSPKITQGVCNVLKNDDNLEESYRRER